MELHQMKGFITFAVLGLTEEQNVTAHYTTVYKMNDVLFWRGFEIVTHPMMVEADIKNEIKAITDPENLIQ